MARASSGSGQLKQLARAGPSGFSPHCESVKPLRASAALPLGSDWPEGPARRLSGQREAKRKARLAHGKF